MSDEDETVRRGIDLLERRGPEGWRDRLRGKTIDVETSDECPLGHVYGYYWVGTSELGLKTRRDAQRHGFHCVLLDPDGDTYADPDSHCNSDELNEAWRRALDREPAGV